MSETFPIPFGRYQLIERLAMGGMAELFLARPVVPSDHAPRNKVVIKRLLPHMAHDPNFNAMFIDEARLTARLTHPNIVETYEIGRHQSLLFIVMEHVDGLDVLALLRECAHRKVRLPTEVAVYIIHEVLDALDFAHNQVDDNGKPMGVVHRDISPSNVLLSRRGEVKLLDFGIARASQRHHDTKDGTLKGKYGYMSPEQVLDQGVDARSDLFSVGIVLTEMLTGRRLFAAPAELDVLLMVRDVKLDRLDKYGSHIGLDLDRILRKALSKSPNARFSSAAEFRDVLAEWMFMHQARVNGTTVGHIVESMYEDAWRRKRQGMEEANATRAALLAGVSDNLPTQAAPIISQLTEDPGELSQVDGIPLGHMGGHDSLPLVSIEMADSAAVMAHVAIEVVDAPADTVDAPVPIPTAADRTAAFAVAERSETDLIIDLNDMDEASGAIPIVRQNEQSQKATAPVTLDVRRFGSVEAAVAALGGIPTARDFDDSEISMVQRGKQQAVAMGQSGPVSGPSVDDDEVPDDTGSFTETPPIAVLYRLAVSRATGLLVVSVGVIFKEIYLREGIPEYVSSNVATELFGEYLVQSGALSDGELAMALAMMPHYRNKLGDTLVGLGLLKPLEVFRHLTRQVRQKLIDVCTWTRGTFRWYGGRENNREAFPLDLNAFEVFGAGALAVPEVVISDWVLRTSRQRPYVVQTSRTGPEVFQLGKLMNEVYESIDGRRTVKELREQFMARKDHDRSVRVLYLLVQTGLVGLE